MRDWDQRKRIEEELVFIGERRNDNHFQRQECRFARGLCILFELVEGLVMSDRL